MSSQPTDAVHTSWTKDISAKGEFVRSARTFRNTVTADGSSGFKAEPDRYHLYVSLACPWAHRTLIMRKLKGLEHIFTVDVVDHFLDRSTGWSLLSKSPNATPDTVNGFKYLREVYFQSDPDYSSSFTVPVLYDKKNKTIVNNESSEIIRMLNSEFNEFATNKELDLYPVALRSKIDEINSWIYPNINDGVYKCGFARSQEAYETAFHNLFNALDKVESILSENRYLAGDQLTEADIRLFTTLVRFDSVYVGHFKTNLKRIVDYPNIWNYLLELYQTKGFGETVNMYHIKHHYYESHININPLGIVPVGPVVDFTQPHNREDKFPKKK